MVKNHRYILTINLLEDIFKSSGELTLLILRGYSEINKERNGKNVRISSDVK